MLILAVKVPSVAERHDTVIVQLELAGTLPFGKLQVLVWVQTLPLPLMKLMLLIAIGDVAAFWKVTLLLTDLLALVLMLNDVGETFTAVPSPLISKPCFTRQMLA
jgi:hypothetical protein